MKYLILIALMLLPSLAQAKVLHGHHHRQHVTVSFKAPVDKPVHFSYHKHRFGAMALVSVSVRRPSAWCGWFARFNFVERDPGPDFNLAANWRRIGTPDPSPASGDIAVWPHHVGKIVGQCNGYLCPVWSGNDGHMVRTRMRSVSGAVFRRV